MNIADYLTISAIIVAPILAVQVQKWLEKFNEKQQRKMIIFRTLMTTRASRLSLEHVQALNMIDIEFYGKRFLCFHFQSRQEKNVVDAWEEYLSHLTSLSPTPSQEELQNWSEASNNLFTILLGKIANATGYYFNSTHLKRGMYSPRAHGDAEQYSAEMRENLKKITTGEKAILIKISS